MNFQSLQGLSITLFTMVCSGCTVTMWLELVSSFTVSLSGRYFHENSLTAMLRGQSSNYFSTSIKSSSLRVKTLFPSAHKAVQEGLPHLVITPADSKGTFRS